MSADALDRDVSADALDQEKIRNSPSDLIRPTVASTKKYSCHWSFPDNTPPPRRICQSERRAPPPPSYRPSTLPTPHPPDLSVPCFYYIYSGVTHTKPHV